MLRIVLSLLAATTAALVTGCSDDSLTASRGWLERNGDTSLAIDTSAPGYEAGWNFNPAVMHSLKLTVHAAEVNNIALWTAALQLEP